jgi:hypothetical protein
MIVIPEKDKDFVIETIIESARSGDKGQFGDGKYSNSVTETYTISNARKKSIIQTLMKLILAINELPNAGTKSLCRSWTTSFTAMRC